MAMGFGLERINRYLEASGEHEKITHIVFEKRGRKEDDELELEFRRVCDGDNYFNEPLPFEIVFADKKANSSGLQSADLLARPIGRAALNPKQGNRAYDIISKTAGTGTHRDRHTRLQGQAQQKNTIRKTHMQLCREFLCKIIV